MDPKALSDKTVYPEVWGYSIPVPPANHGVALPSHNTSCLSEIKVGNYTF
ncbi:MAG: hypothetical protein Q8917_17250 [Bacillota bacterium]|nr:hypothetical protein [Bacillota bacterium]